MSNSELEISSGVRKRPKNRKAKKTPATDCQQTDSAEVSDCKNGKLSLTEELIFTNKIKRPPRVPRRVKKPTQDVHEANVNCEDGNSKKDLNTVEILTSLIETVDVSQIDENEEPTPSSSQASHPKKKKKKKKKLQNKSESQTEPPSEPVPIESPSETVQTEPATETNKQADLPLKETVPKVQKKKAPLAVNAKFPDYLPRQYVEDLLQGKVSDGHSYIQGELRINPRFYKHAFLTLPGDDEDLLIADLLDRNRALQGDIVVAVIYPEEDWVTREDGTIQKTGRVVHILKKVHSREVVGTIKFSGGKCLLMPRDPRLPILVIEYPEFVLRVPDLSSDHLFIAMITEWNTVFNAYGVVLEMLGKKGDIQAETAAILRENNLSVIPYSGSVLEGLPPADYVPTTQDLEGREDWRDRCVFTIDPATAVDLDDAVSCKLLNNGNYEVGVHISDVTHFLKASTPLDKMVAERATTVYLADTVYHMLPKQLCQTCSLLPGCDKLAFSVIWEMTPEALPVKHRFAKTVINSCCQLSYDMAQQMIDNPKADHNVMLKCKYSVEEIIDTVSHLYKLSIQMRKRRFDGGALRIDQPKMYIEIDRNLGRPTSFKIEEFRDSNRLIEEFMLLANITVAEHLYNKVPEYALLRSHDEPPSQMLTKTVKMMESLGINLNAISAGSLQSSLNQYMPNGKTKESKEMAEYKMMVINSLCAKLMKRATYICSQEVSEKENLRHYALNVALYTHFTSPIRRYADCVVHRLLSASLNVTPLCSKWNSTLCRNIAMNCNTKKYNAKLAQEQSCELYFAYYLQLTSSIITLGIVLEVKEAYLDALLCNIGLKVRVFYADVKKNAKVKYSKGMVPSIFVKWTEKNVAQQVFTFSLVNLVVSKHPDRLRVHGNLIPPIPT